MWQRAKYILTIVTLLSIFSTLLAGCGGTEATATTAPAPPAAATDTPAAAAPAATDTTAAAPAADTPTTAAMTDATATTGGAATGATATTGGSTGGALVMPADCPANVELQYWNPFTGPDGPFMGQLVDKFNAANPSIKVTMTTQRDYYTQLGTAQASDTLPDVAIIHADQLATQAYGNVIRPIDDVVKAVGVTEADYPAAVWAPGNIAGKRYSVPLDIHPAVLYYNEDLLKKYNISAPPKNRDEFEKAAAAMTADGNKGYMYSAGFFNWQIFSMVLVGNGGSLFNEDGSKATWNSPEGVEAMTWLKKAQTTYGESKLESDAELNAFKAGTVGMVLNGIWQISNVTGAGVSFAGKGTSVPQLGTKKPATWAGSHQLTLPVHKNGNDKCKDAAAAMFIKYVVDNSIEWSKAGQIPALNKVRSSAEFKAIEPQASIAPSVENAFFPPSVPGITDAFGPLGDAVGAILSDNASDIKAALDESVNKANQILEQNKGKYGTAPK